MNTPSAPALSAVEEPSQEGQCDCTIELRASLVRYQKTSLALSLALFTISFGSIVLFWLRGTSTCPSVISIPIINASMVGFTSIGKLIRQLVPVQGRCSTREREWELTLVALWLPWGCVLLLGCSEKCFAVIPLHTVMAWTSLILVYLWFSSSLNWERLNHDLVTGNVWRPVQTMTDIHEKWAKLHGGFCIFRTLLSFACILVFVWGGLDSRGQFKEASRNLTIASWSTVVYHAALVFSYGLMSPPLPALRHLPFRHSDFLGTLCLTSGLLIIGWILTGTDFSLGKGGPAWWTASLYLLSISVFLFTIQICLFVKYVGSTHRLAASTSIPVVVAGDPVRSEERSNPAPPGGYQLL